MNRLLPELWDVIISFIDRNIDKCRMLMSCKEISLRKFSFDETVDINKIIDLNCFDKFTNIWCDKVPIKIPLLLNTISWICRNNMLSKGLNSGIIRYQLRRNHIIFKQMISKIYCIKYDIGLPTNTVFYFPISFRELFMTYTKSITFCIDFYQDGSSIRYGHRFSKQNNDTFKSSPLLSNNKNEVFIINPDDTHFQIEIVLSQSESGIIYDRTIIKN